jgi:hypothetical protein
MSFFQELKLKIYDSLEITKDGTLLVLEVHLTLVKTGTYHFDGLNRWFEGRGSCREIYPNANWCLFTVVYSM